MALLTDQILATGVSENDLIHIVITGDTSQNPAGSSYKATIGQVIGLVSGHTGTSGTSGTNGTSGTSGVNGSSGTNGTSGVNGASGTNGTSGVNGTSGTNGTSGFNGTSGTSGTGGTDQNLSQVLNEGNFTGENNIVVTSGTTIIYEHLESPQYRGLLGFDSFGNTIAVSPDDLTPKPYYGQISNITGDTFSIDSAGDYQEMKVSSNLDLNYEIIKGVNYGMSLMNDSDEDILLDVYGSADITAGNNKVLGIKLAVNGIPIDETECRAPTGVGTSFAKLVTSWMVILNPEDEVSLFVTNFTNTGDITVDRARLVGKRVLHRVDSVSPSPLP
jgi:hypothetical protein